MRCGQNKGLWPLLPSRSSLLRPSCSRSPLQRGSSVAAGPRIASLSPTTERQRSHLALPLPSATLASIPFPAGAANSDWFKGATGSPRWLSRVLCHVRWGTRWNRLLPVRGRPPPSPTGAPPARARHPSATETLPLTPSTRGGDLQRLTGPGELQPHKEEL